MTTKIRVLLLFFLFSFVSANLYAQVKTWASFPQMAAGPDPNVDTTLITYVTIGDPIMYDTPRVVGVSFYNPEGKAMEVTVDHGIGKTSFFTFPLPNPGEITFSITSDTFVTGRIEIYAEGVAKFNSSVRYVYRDSLGRIADVVGVLPSNSNYNWTITLDKQEAWQHVGVAIANWWSNVDVEVYFDLYQNGTYIDSTTRPIPALGRLATYVDGDGGLFPTFNGMGTLRISCSDAPISVMAARDDGSQFSSLPADAVAQLWRWSYTTDSSTTYTGYWSWRFTDEPTFIGSEHNSWNDNLITVRGVYDTTHNPFPFFILEWWYFNSDTDPSDQGTILFQGTPEFVGNTEVINGTRVIINANGITEASDPFSATRIY